jgi:hypothetical protein
MNKDEVIALMSTSKSEEEWNNNCDEVKRRCGGYPSFWYSTIVISGLMAQITAGFNK